MHISHFRGLEANRLPDFDCCRMLEQKLTEAKSKKDTLKARAKSAQTTRQINDMIQGLNLNNSMAAFDRMEEKVMALESESEATLQVGLTHCFRPKLFCSLYGPFEPPS